MPKSKEFTIRIEDKPGALGKCCRALADRGVNILAFQAYDFEGQGLIRMVVDNPGNREERCWMLNTSTVLETEVAQVPLPHRPGELSRAASDSAKPMSISTTLIAEQSLDRTCHW